MVSIYQLKSRFQQGLRPLLGTLVKLGIRANHVTLFAMLSSIGYGLWLWRDAGSPLPWALLPLFLFLRMALNAIDGMLAREHGQQSCLGGILNEAGDVVSDAALYLPFALIAPTPLLAVLCVLLAFLTEYIGVLGPMLGASRRYDGPFGKSDRAFAYGLGALLLAWNPGWAVLADWAFAAASALLLFTCANRARAILAEGDKRV
ncbi:CDP-alcohol phosphatidyltransferase family protein [Chromobacterium sp. IIBBL 290-4]|uniref:CDP-alcohol phosphatidyltransferase family protein n=1 Tax=Chromobacterium sp. IIBBL 290-4 TaxID=2953890 RepID=UPI0020B821EE|nr:CDP-alcohol phosphatidyltransferase family protein [Chromobacterium sp. IIBBL 290-4]UTH74813.1 CDP-alcohol phosphatidyltransferase family protein [Chromobacterium sp. IIBBL 290-4]